MPFMLTRIRVDDYDSWKAVFDTGRDTVRAHAKGHRVLRAVDSSGDLFIQVEFDTLADAQHAREALMGSGMMERFQVKVPPTVAEQVELATY